MLINRPRQMYVTRKTPYRPTAFLNESLFSMALVATVAFFKVCDLNIMIFNVKGLSLYDFIFACTEIILSQRT